MNRLDELLGEIRNLNVRDYLPKEWRNQSVVPSDIFDKAREKLRAEAKQKLIKWRDEAIERHIKFQEALEAADKGETE